MLKQAGFAQLTTVVLVLILVGLGYFLFENTLNRFNHSVPLPDPESFEQVDSVISRLKEELYLQGSEIIPGEAVWINDYANLSLLKGQQFNSLNPVNSGEIEGISYILDSFFDAQGFNKDEINTFSTLDDPDQLIAVRSFGYTQGSLKCLAALYPDSQPSGYFFCGDVNGKKDELQKQFLPVIYSSSSQYPLRKDEAAVVDVFNISDDFAMGSNNRYLRGIYEPSGTRWIAAKVDGDWKLVFEGQDLPACTLVDRYKVPKEFYSNCFEVNGSLRFEEEKNS